MANWNLSLTGNSPEIITVSPETTPQATPETTPQATPEATPQATPEATPQATPEATPQATPEATPQATPEATPQATPEATPTATPEATANPTQAPEESQQVAEPLPQEAIPGWGLAAMGLAAGLAIAGIAALVVRRIRRKPSAPDRLPATAPGSFWGSRPPIPFVVEKLHEQGARKSQQDSFYVSAPGGRMLAVVADGMGGLADGDKVSQAAVTAMANGFFHAQGKPGQVLLSLLEQANHAVNGLLGPDGLRRSGSTMVAALIENSAFHYLSVGDSRICLFRDGALYQLNREHIYRNELYTDGVNGLCSLQEAESHPKGGGLTSFLGMGELKYVDIPAQPVVIREGDVFVLMSDGVYNALTEYEMIQALSAPGSIADALRSAIQAKGYSNQDNYTAVIVRRHDVWLDDDGNPREP